MPRCNCYSRGFSYLIIFGGLAWSSCTWRLSLLLAVDTAVQGGSGQAGADGHGRAAMVQVLAQVPAQLKERLAGAAPSAPAPALAPLPACVAVLRSLDSISCFSGSAARRWAIEWLLAPCKTVHAQTCLPSHSHPCQAVCKSELALTSVKPVHAITHPWTRLLASVPEQAESCF